MLLVIHNLPSSTRYIDVKNLIQMHCALNNVILDNLVNEGLYKKVTVGVADEADAAVIERNLNGMNLNGNHLYVEDMRHKKEKFDSNKGNRWNSAPMPNNMPPLLGHSSMNLGQNSSMMGPNNPVMNQIMDLHPPFMRQNNSMGPIAPLMGHISPLMGQPPGQMGPNSPMMVPPPLMGQGSTPFSGPFYMTPQNNEYGNDGNGQPMADQYPSRKDDVPSQSYGCPDTGNRPLIPDKPISVWASPEENSIYSRGFSGNERERYQSQLTSSRRTKWDTAQEEYEGFGAHDTSKRVRPWAVDNSPPYNQTEYEPFDRSYDRGQESYSREMGDSGAILYQRRPFACSESGTNYRSHSPPEFRRDTSRYDFRGRGGRSPPPKRLRADYNAPNFKFGPTNWKDRKSFKRVKFTLSKIVERDVAWRNQAAAQIVNDMFTKIQPNSAVPHNVAFTMMKTAVRHRLLILLNNWLEVKIPDLVLMYRRRFKPEEDQCLYNRIVRHILHERKRKPKPADSGAQDVPDVDPDAPKTSKPEKTVEQLTATPVDPTTQTLPKYPKGDKAAYKLQKQQFKKELTEQSEPALSAVMKKAIDLELDSLKDIILGECTDPKHEGQSMFCKRMNEPEIMDEIRRMITINLAKRLLNLGTVPLIRIVGVPKLPRKALLDDFLKTRGVISLKKSDRKPMYIATCDSYESFDNLSAMKDIVIDNVKVIFKPMYLTAPPEKGKHKKNKQSTNMQCVETPDNKPDVKINVKADGQQEAGTDDKTDSQSKNINQEIEKTAADIKKELVTLLKNKPTEVLSSEGKEELLTSDNSKSISQDSVIDEKCHDNVKQEEGDDCDNEDDDAEYPTEDSELNEDDLEDY